MMLHTYEDGALVTPDQDMIERWLARYTPHYVDRIGEYASYGGRYYNDHGHPETSTPEHTRLDALVASELADERLVLATFEAAVADSACAVSRFMLNKRVITTEGIAWGSHDDYQVLREVFEPREAQGAHAKQYMVLGLHLATRGIYAGSGAIRNIGQKYVFVTAQKATALTTTYSHSTTTEKPLINTRDTPYADRGKYSRLHVVSGDALLGPWAIKMKIGTTKLIIDALEAGIHLEGMPVVPMGRMYEYAKSVAKDPSCQAILYGSYGQKLTAIDIQHKLLHMAKRYVSQCTEPKSDDVWVIEQWQLALGQLEHEPLGLRDRADWPMRQSLLVSFAEKHNVMRKDDEGQWEPDWSNMKLRAIDLQFDQIKSGASIVTSLRGRADCWGQWMVPEELIRKRMVDEPEVPRAAARHRAIKKFAGKLGMETARVGWDFIEIPGHTYIRMPDPLHVDEKKLAELLT